MSIANPYGLTALSVCLCAGAAQAIDNTNINGVTWSHTYEGDVLPSANSPAFVESGSFVGGTDGNVLSIFNGYAQMVGGIGSPNWDGSSPSGTTFEVRMRLTSQTGTFGGSFEVGNQLGYAGLAVATNYVQVLGGGGNAIHYLDATQFHTYRITITPANLVFFYFDNDPNPLGNFVIAGGTYNNFDIGTGGGGSGSSQYDYVRWTNAGAFPVPEPGAGLLAWLAVGLGLAVRRRAG